MRTISDEDLKKIHSREPDLEIARLWDGLGSRRSEHRRWAWERKYELNFSIPGTSGELEAAYQAGMLKKAQLENGKYYWGITRHGRVAMWSDVVERFLYRRKKGRWFTEMAPHPEDEHPGYNFFIPWLQVEPVPHEVVPYLPTPENP